MSTLKHVGVVNSKNGVPVNVGFGLNDIGCFSNDVYFQFLKCPWCKLKGLKVRNSEQAREIVMDIFRFCEITTRGCENE